MGSRRDVKHFSPNFLLLITHNKEKQRSKQPHPATGSGLSTDTGLLKPGTTVRSSLPGVHGAFSSYLLLLSLLLRT